MTMLVCTVTPGRCLISQDNFITIPSAAALDHAARKCGVADSAERSEETTYVGGGGPDTVNVYGSACKIIPFPRLNMAMAGTGDFHFLMQWWHNLIHRRFDDIFELDQHAPELLRDLAKKSGDPAVAVVHAGWSRQAGCSVARVYSFDQDFRSVEIRIGTTLGVTPDPEDPEYEKIEALWKDASERSVGIERLHAELYRQLQRSYLAGRLAPGSIVGGGLVHCSVSGVGIDMRNADVD